MSEILNDYQHLVENTIKQHQDNTDFPAMERYHITQTMLKDYLFDKQAIPVLVMSVFSEKQLPWGEWSVIIAVLIGLLLFAVYKVLLKLFIKYKLKKLHNDNVEAYIEAILNYRR